jgi:flagellar hook protein FlgE
MSIRTAISGLNAAQTDLATTANNIANASTTGFKGARAEFADLFSAGSAGLEPGTGVRVSGVVQNFAQGDLAATGRDLDLGINGNGFFVVQTKEGTPAYTRAGAFQLDRDGYLANGAGDRLQTYKYVDGRYETGVPSTLRVIRTSEAKPTEKVGFGFNLPALGTAAPDLGVSFNPADPKTYNFSTATTVYDSQGGAHVATVYLVKNTTVRSGQAQATPTAAGDIKFKINGSEIIVSATTADAANKTAAIAAINAKTASTGVRAVDDGANGIKLEGTKSFTTEFVSSTATPNTGAAAAQALGLASLGTAATPTVTRQNNDWSQYLYVGGSSPSNLVKTDGVPPADSVKLSFDANGALTSPTAGEINYGAYLPPSGASDIKLKLDLSTATQIGSAFNVTSVDQDGYTSGSFISMSVDNLGVIRGSYTNGQQIELGKIAVANFSVPQALATRGNSSWSETFASGSAVFGSAGSGGLGDIRSGTLESSNVDITEQLVNMITAQRNFQANAKVVSTADQLAQSIINLR